MQCGISGASRRCRVLVVEDEVLVRMLIVEELRFAGFDVVEAASADEALAYVRSGLEIDAVFSDVRMPGSLDGEELAAQLRSTMPGLVVLLTSGYLGASPLSDPSLFIPKPYTPTHVVHMLTRLLMARGTDDPSDRLAC